MNPITIAEAEITAPQVNSQDFLVFRVRVSPQEWNEQIRKKIYDAYQNGTPMSIVMQPFQSEKTEDPIPKKRSHLAHLMKSYCEKEGIKEEDEVNKLYQKYNISSRAQLTEEQLDKEIDSYKAGLMWDN